MKSFSWNVNIKSKILTGLWLALSLGSRFLYVGVILETFKISGNILFGKASFIHFFSFEK